LYKRLIKGNWLCLVLLAPAPALPFICNSAAFAADIPESIHRAYIKGATSVELPKDPVAIPLEGTSWLGNYRRAYVTVYVNGRGPYTFIFDTGSNVTTISSKVARDVSPTIVSDVPGHHAIAVLKVIRAGGVSMRKVYVVVADGDYVDGILGLNAFGLNTITIDMHNRKLVLGSSPPKDAAYFWLPYTLKRHHLPTIELKMYGRSLSTLIDSGDDAYAWEGTTNDLRGLLLDGVPRESALVYGGDQGTARTKVGTIDGKLYLGPFFSDRPAVAINDSLPLPDIGIDVIRQFVVSFDRRRQVVGFRPLFSGKAFSTPGELTYGIFISFRQLRRTIRDVLPGTAPASYQISPGDQILTMNGTNASEVSFRQWDEGLRMRRPLAITWLHRGKRMTGVFQVVELK